MKNPYSLIVKLSSILFIALLFIQCRKDDDMNYRIRIENHCDFGIKVYYDNQDIEHYEDGDRDVSVTGSVTVVAPNNSKKVFSKEKYVWVETSTPIVKSRKFKCYNANIFLKEIKIYPEDF